MYGLRASFEFPIMWMIAFDANFALNSATVTSSISTIPLSKRSESEMIKPIVGDKG